jgi:putative RecB family exonuclease
MRSAVLAAIAPPVPDQSEAADSAHPSLSPSRAADFLACPLLYRFRVIDHLKEPPSPAAARGTLVHAVLERLFDEPSAGRTPAAARSLLEPQWQRLAAAEPELAELFADEEQLAPWLDEAATMLDRYFTLEDPTRLEPAYREMSVQAMLESGLALRGYIDRLDVANSGAVRIVDYKTGTAPREEYEARALFQMKFYALVLWRASGTIPRLLQLIYLGNGEIVRYAPDEADLIATERKINALWRAIERARSTGDWRPRPSRLCEWCTHQAICPAFGGTPPPLPQSATDQDPAPSASEHAIPRQATVQPAPTDGPADPASRHLMLCLRKMSSISERSLSAAGTVCLVLAAGAIAALPSALLRSAPLPSAPAACSRSRRRWRAFRRRFISGSPPVPRKNTAASPNSRRPAQVFGAHTNDPAKLTNAAMTRYTSRIAPLR